MNKELDYIIKKEIAVLSERSNGWTKQINLVSWNGGAAKYDIREWAPERKKAGKGITLTAAETQTLLYALENLDL